MAAEAGCRKSVDQGGGEKIFDLYIFAGRVGYSHLSGSKYKGRNSPVG
jgi:hypothetical protein